MIAIKAEDLMAGHDSAIVLSPHLDDAVWSVGALIARLSGLERAVTVWTAFTDFSQQDSPAIAELSRRLGADFIESYSLRRDEDRRATRLLGAESQHGGMLDAPTRGDGWYDSPERLVGSMARVHESDRSEAAIVERILALVGARGSPIVLAPAGFGGHVDHRVVAAAGKSLAAHGVAVWIYEDFPYVARTSRVVPEDWEIARQATTVLLTQNDVALHLGAAKTYQSQVKLFYPTSDELDAAICEHLQVFSPGGPRLRLRKCSSGDT